MCARNAESLWEEYYLWLLWGGYLKFGRNRTFLSCDSFYFGAWNIWCAQLLSNFRPAQLWDACSCQLRISTHLIIARRRGHTCVSVLQHTAGLRVLSTSTLHYKRPGFDVHVTLRKAKRAVQHQLENLGTPHMTQCRCSAAPWTQCYGSWHSKGQERRISLCGSSTEKSWLLKSSATAASVQR